MDTSVLLATLTSLTAIGSTIMLLRVLRQDRQRSDARVAALVALAAGPAAGERAVEAELAAAPVTFAAPPLRLEPKPRASAPPARTPAHARPAEAAALNAGTVEIFRNAQPASPGGDAAPELFEPAARRARNSLIYVGAAAMMMAAVIALSFGWALSPDTTPAAETTAAIDAPAPVPVPLALLALRHEQSSDGTLVISGVVRNPPGSASRQKLFAAASLLDASGALVATARAPLDFTILEPGDESPFVVRVNGAGEVTRYRIGFRDAGGASIAHLDRR